MTRTFGVEIKMQNSGNKVRPGMYARVTMNLGTENRVVVPDQTVVKQVGSGNRYVYVYKDGKVSFNEVKLGQRLDAEYKAYFRCSCRFAGSCRSVKAQRSDGGNRKRKKETEANK